MFVLVNEKKLSVGKFRPRVFFSGLKKSEKNGII